MRRLALKIWPVVALAACGSPDDVTVSRSPIDSEADSRHVVEESIDTLAARVLDDTLIRGLSIGVYEKGEIYTGHYGELDPGMGNRPNDETLYEIASISKTFTGTLAAKAVLGGLLSLDTDIRDVLPEDYPNLQYEGEPIRVRHLLTHTSGLPVDSWPMDDSATDDGGLDWQRIHEAELNASKSGFIQYLHDIEVRTKPGDEFLYSNLGTNVMAYLLETVHGMPFHDLVREAIFERAGLRETAFLLTPEQQSRLAAPYSGTGEPRAALFLSERLWGAEGGLKSSVPDLLRYARFHIDETDSVVAESHQRLHQLDEGYWIGYFWWIIDVEDGVRSYRHDGGSSGVRNVLIVYPEYDLATYVVTNSASETTFDTLSKLSRDLLQVVRSRAGEDGQ